MSRRFDLDEIALLEEERDDLLASLDRIDGELGRMELDAEDHAQLRDDLTRRAAAVIRRIDDREEARPDRVVTKPARRIMTGLVIVAIAIAAAVAVANSSGLRIAGQSGSGEIDQSSRDLLLQAEIQFAAGDIEAAAAAIEEILIRLPDDPDALVARARIEETEGRVLDAIVTLDTILATDPDSVDALTVKGWILVRLGEEDLVLEGIRLLDAAIALDPPVFDPYLFRAVTAERVEEDPIAAIGYYRAALARNPPEAMVPQIERFIAALED